MAGLQQQLDELLPDSHVYAALRREIGARGGTVDTGGGAVNVADDEELAVVGKSFHSIDSMLEWGTTSGYSSLWAGLPMWSSAWSERESVSHPCGLGRIVSFGRSTFFRNALRSERDAAAAVQLNRSSSRMSARKNFKVELKGRTVTADEPGRRVFRLKRGAETELEVTYRDPSATFLAKSDPTRDTLDEELDDMFLWVVNLSRDESMRADLAESWSRGR